MRGGTDVKLQEFAGTPASDTDFYREVDCRAYRRLGCHPTGDGGHRFRVWAPGAVDVTLVGDFNNWDESSHRLHRMGESGVWECEVQGVAEYDTYKYCITAGDGTRQLKSDPYAYHFETRPANASKVYHLDGYCWNDAKWMKQKEKE